MKIIKIEVHDEINVAQMMTDIFYMYQLKIKAISNSDLSSGDPSNLKKQNKIYEAMNILDCELINNKKAEIAELEAENRLLRNTGVAQQESIEKLEAVLKRIANPPDHIPSATAHSLWSIEVAQAALEDRSVENNAG